MNTERRWRVALVLSVAIHLFIIAIYCIFANRVSAHPKMANSAVVILLTPSRPDVQRLRATASRNTTPTFSRETLKAGGTLAGGSQSGEQAKILSMPKYALAPDRSVVASAPTVQPQAKAASDVSIVTTDVPVEVAKAADPSMTESPEVVSEAPVEGTSNDTNPGTVVTETGKPSGVVTGTGTGSGASGSGNGNGDGTGLGNGNGNGNGTGVGKGTTAGNGDGNGTGDSDGAYASGGNGLPYGLETGMGNDAPKRIVYVLDVSPSMQTKIKAAVKETLSVMSQLVHQDMFDVILFGDTVNMFQPKLIAISPLTLSHVAYFLNTPIETKGGTNLEAAVTAALQIPGAQDMVVVTDGIPTKGEDGPHRLANLIRKRNVNHMRIYTVGLMNSMDDSPDDIDEATLLLQLLAQENGGATRVLDVAKW